jgi:hypothetical protein
MFSICLCMYVWNERYFQYGSDVWLERKWCCDRLVIEGMNTVSETCNIFPKAENIEIEWKCERTSSKDTASCQWCKRDGWLIFDLMIDNVKNQKKIR